MENIYLSKNCNLNFFFFFQTISFIPFLPISYYYYLYVFYFAPGNSTFIKHIKFVFILTVDRKIQTHQEKCAFLYSENFLADRPKVLISKLKQTMTVN